MGAGFARTRLRRPNAPHPTLKGEFVKMPELSFPPRGRYRHFKGNEYELLDFARHSETQEWMVVYRALYGEGALWVRPLTMWQEPVTRDGVTYPHRFTRVAD